MSETPWMRVLTILEERGIVGDEVDVDVDAAAQLVDELVAAVLSEPPADLREAIAAAIMEALVLWNVPPGAVMKAGDAVLAVVARYQQEHDKAIRQRIEALPHHHGATGSHGAALLDERDVLEALAAPAPSRPEQGG